MSEARASFHALQMNVQPFGTRFVSVASRSAFLALPPVVFVHQVAVPSATHCYSRINPIRIILVGAPSIAQGTLKHIADSWMSPGHPCAVHRPGHSLYAGFSPIHLFGSRGSPIPFAQWPGQCGDAPAPALQSVGDETSQAMQRWLVVPWCVLDDTTQCT